MWPSEKLEACGCTIYGLQPFRAAVTSAMRYLLNSSSAQPYVKAFPQTIVPPGLFFMFCGRRSSRLVLSLKITRLEPEYLSCYILYATVINDLASQDTSDIAAALQALRAQIELAQELALEPSYLHCLQANLAVLELGVFPRSLLRHPAY